MGSVITIERRRYGRPANCDAVPRIERRDDSERVSYLVINRVADHTHKRPQCRLNRLRSRRGDNGRVVRDDGSDPVIVQCYGDVVSVGGVARSCDDTASNGTRMPTRLRRRNALGYAPASPRCSSDGPS